LILSPTKLGKYIILDEVTVAKTNVTRKGRASKWVEQQGTAADGRWTEMGSKFKLMKDIETSVKKM